MADIRNYLKEKEKRERQTASYQEKIHKHRLSFVYRTILSVLVVAALAVLITIQYQNLTYESYDNVVSVNKTEVAGTVEKSLGNMLLTYSKDGAHCTDAKGVLLWNQTYEMQSPIFVANGNVVAFADYNGRTIYIYDTAGRLGTVDTTMPLRHMSVAANGVVAAVLEASDVTWLKIYDTEGTTLVESKISMKNSGYPVSVSLSPTGLLCAVSYIYTDMGKIKTSVAFYNFGEVGKNQTDNFVCGYDYSDSVVPLVQFMDGNHAFAVGDDRLLFFRGNQKPENINNILLSEEVQAVYYSEQYVGLVLPDTSGGGRRLDIYDSSGNKISSHEIQIDYMDIVFDNQNYIIYNESEMYVGTVKGKEKYNGLLNKQTSVIIPTGKAYRYTMVTRNSIDTIRLR